MIKPFARGSFPEGSKRQHHFSFCFVILNMAWAWSDSVESCPIHLRAQTGTAGRSLPWLIQQGTRGTTAILFRCYCCCSASQGMCEGAGPAVINILDCYFLLELQHPGWGGTSKVGCLQRHWSPQPQCNTYLQQELLFPVWKDREKCPRLSWSDLEASSQQGRSPHCCLCWVISEQFRCYCSTSLCFSIRFII